MYTETEITNHAKKLFKEELTKLNFKHMDKLDKLVEGYVGALYESEYVDEQGENILNFITEHFLYWAQNWKQQENEMEW